MRIELRYTTRAATSNLFGDHLLQSVDRRVVLAKIRNIGALPMQDGIAAMYVGEEVLQQSIDVGRI
jgi:hypothetical protein